MLSRASSWESAFSVFHHPLRPSLLNAWRDGNRYDPLRSSCVAALMLNHSAFLVVQFQGRESVCDCKITPGRMSRNQHVVNPVPFLPLPTRLTAHRHLQIAAVVLAPLNDNAYYPPPQKNDTAQNECGCNTIIYSLISACSICQRSYNATPNS
jgi:hypothetical protein